MNFTETARELVRCLKPGGMLILAEGDAELNLEDQITFAGRADPNSIDPTQGGKTWVAHKINGMCSIPPSAPIDTILSANLTDLSYISQQRSWKPKNTVVVTSCNTINELTRGYGTTPQWTPIAVVWQIYFRP